MGPILKKPLRKIPVFICFACLLALPPVSRAATPEQIRQRLGVYIWGRVPDLAAAASDARRLGTHNAVRAFIGPWSDNPPYKIDLRPLARKLSAPGYQKIFRDFPVIMLTAYDSFSYAREYGAPSSAEDHAKDQGAANASATERKNGHAAHPSSMVAKDLASMTAAEQQKFLSAVQQEFKQFSFELSKLDRTFIVSNWEAENDVPDAKDWPAFRLYLQARLDGIAAGRAQARAKGYPARVLTAFEFSIVPGFQGRPSGLVEIGAKLRGVDYLSYSSWWSIGADLDAEGVRKSFRYAIGLIRKFAQQASLPQRVIVGEFGEYWNEHHTAERLKAIVETSIDEGAEYVFNWVLYEQPGERDEHGSDASHMGKYFLNHQLTPQGRAFQEWLQEWVVSRPAEKGNAPAVPHSSGAR
jgi:hypothetical protein